MDAPSVEFTFSMPGIEVCRVTGSQHVFPRHFHDDLYSVGLMSQGACQCLGPGKDDATVSRGQACLINPGQVHSGVPVSGQTVSYTMLYLSRGLVRSMAEDLSQRPQSSPEFTRLICANGALVEALNRLAGDLATKRGLAAESALVRVLGDVLQAHGAIRPEARDMIPGFIRQAKEMLSADLERKVTLKDMAAVIGISQYHFLRSFKRQTGVPPHVFRTQCRVELAQTLVRQGRALADIAQLTGFTDQSHFTNTFKHYTGATPGQYASAT